MPIDNGILSLITSIGAAGVFFYVFQKITNGDLHTKQEVEGLRADNTELKEIIRRFSTALDESNKLDAKLIEHAGQAMELRKTKQLLEKALQALDERKKVT